MANLNGQYLDSLTFYKGLINIGSTVGQNVTSSLQSLTDGDGNNLPIQVSTSQIIIGGGTSAGRLVVRGDGTNPIARFEDSAGNAVLTLPATNGTAQRLLFSGNYIGFNNNPNVLIGVEAGNMLFYNGGNRFVVGPTGDITTFGVLSLIASTTAKSSLVFKAGVAPTAPTDGSVWFDGTDLKMRIGGVTKTFTLV